MVSFLKKYLNQYIKYYIDWKKNQKEYNHLRDLLKSVPNKKIMDKKIVFNIVRSVKVQIDRELFIALLLSLNGAKCFVLLDDGVLKLNEIYQVNDFPHLRELKNINLNSYPHFYKLPENYFHKIINKIFLRKVLKTFRNPNLKILYYSKIIDRKDLNINNWRELKDYAISSTIRFFKTSELNYRDEFVKYYYKIALMNSILSRNVGKFVLNKINPDYFFTSHGIYSTWAPAFHFLKNHGIKTIVYSSVHGHSLDPREIFVSSNTRTFFLSSSKFWLKYKNTPVTDKMKKSIEEYFQKRQNYSTSDTLILYKGKRTSYTVDKNDGYKYHISLFPNVIWDGNFNDRHKVFKNYRDWILSTIKFVKNRSDIKLYIKSHPSEITVLKGAPRIVDIINKNINLNDFKNVVLIPPDKVINTYEFLKSGIDLGLVYDGFLAAELPFLKIPAIMCVKGGMFAVEGGNFPITSKEQYFNYLENIDDLLKKFNENYQKYYENIVRYVYWYIFVNAIKLPTLSKNSYMGTDLFQLKKEDLIIKNDLLRVFKD